MIDHNGSIPATTHTKVTKGRFTIEFNVLTQGNNLCITRVLLPSPSKTLTNGTLNLHLDSKRKRGNCKSAGSVYVNRKEAFVVGRKKKKKKTPCFSQHLWLCEVRLVLFRETICLYIIGGWRTVRDVIHSLSVPTLLITLYYCKDIITIHDSRHSCVTWLTDVT